MKKRRMILGVSAIIFAMLLPDSGIILNNDVYAETVIRDEPAEENENCESNISSECVESSENPEVNNDELKDGVKLEFFYEAVNCEKCEESEERILFSGEVLLSVEILDEADAEEINSQKDNTENVDAEELEVAAYNAEVSGIENTSVEDSDSEDTDVFNSDNIRITVLENGEEILLEDIKWEASERGKRTEISLKDDGEYIVNISCFNEGEEYKQESKLIEIDRTSPVININFSEPYSTDNNIQYYKSAISADFVIRDKNLSYDGIKAELVGSDGSVQNLDIIWESQAESEGKGRCDFTPDSGEYRMILKCIDICKNNAEYISSCFIFDSSIKEQEIKIDEDLSDAQDICTEADLSINTEDCNISDVYIRITEINMEDTREEITDEISGNGESEIGLAENDIREKDRLLDEVFTLNRNGSVYRFDDYLIRLINKERRYIREVEGDIIVNEYNPCSIDADAIKIHIVKDGELLDNNYVMKLNNTESAEVSRGSAWTNWSYIISKEMFKKDGTYKISFSSVDNAGNISDSSKEGRIIFHIDRTEPEIIIADSLSKNRDNSGIKKINYSIFDVMGISRISLYKDDIELERITDFTEDRNNYIGSLLLDGEEADVSLRIEAEDMAGNISYKNVSYTSSEGKPVIGIILLISVTVSVSVIIVCVAFLKRRNKT